ncbi:hypothetical protein PR048_027838 [Dryococelus australis]|uniref:Uncharacterized protein n=1 Tax=Dryococelus australis TaxID=614101 RepID=A0ABQ9GHL9_9NEOP|nr:hypothetical protein PR048_027838 [Dryococelus australis]
MRGWENRRSPRKHADKWHRLAGSDTAGIRTLFALFGVERSSRSATTVASIKKTEQNSHGCAVGCAVIVRPVFNTTSQEHDSADILLGQIQLGSPLVEDRPIMNAVKYRVVSGVVWTNRTMAGETGDPREKPADQWHSPARFPLAKIRECPGLGLSPVRIGVDAVTSGIPGRRNARQTPHARHLHGVGRRTTPPLPCTISSKSPLYPLRHASLAEFPPPPSPPPLTGRRDAVAAETKRRGAAINGRAEVVPLCERNKQANVMSVGHDCVALSHLQGRRWPEWLSRDVAVFNWSNDNLRGAGAGFLNAGDRPIHSAPGCQQNPPLLMTPVELAALPARYWLEAIRGVSDSL